MDAVLLVDDEMAVRKMLAVRLEDAGYKTLDAENGEEGLEQFQKYRPLVTILDLNMPKMGGKEFLRKLDPKLLANHAVIVLTSSGDDADIQECYDLGVQSFLRKPVNFIELLGTVKRSQDMLHASGKIRELNHNLEETNIRLNSLLENIPEIIWECDKKLRFTYLSPNAEQILDYPVKKMLGEKIGSFLNKDDIEQLKFRFGKDSTQKQDVENVTISFKNREGVEKPIQLLIKRLFNEKGKLVKLIGTACNKQQFAEVTEKIESFTKPLTIKINKRLKLQYIDDGLIDFLPDKFRKDYSKFKIKDTLLEKDTESLLSFAFSQKEDVAFPIKIKIGGDTNGENVFDVDFKYIADEKCLEGQLTPSNTNAQFSMVFQQMDKQKEKLKDAVIITPEMKEAILLDAQNLTAEIYDLVKSLIPYAYQEVEIFNLEHYRQFVSLKNTGVYLDNIRLLGNKIHGLKGATGYLIPVAKELCHKLEDITGPLAECKLVFTEDTYQSLRRFVFSIQEMLEQYQTDETTEFQADKWIQDIETILEKSELYIKPNLEAFSRFLSERSKDSGELRKREQDEYLSVSLPGYKELSQQVKNLFYMFSDTLSDEHRIKAGNLYNEFLDTHQKIKKVPLDLSRYERLVPSLANQYEKKAELIIKNHNVLADREFWNAMHEIFNHVIKNAVIHGIELPAKREEEHKDPVGKITIEIREDALQIYINILDDGQGISLDSIKQKALDNQMITSEQMKSLSKSEILKLMFIQGISTADSLDDNAGRGVGLNAVQEAMQKFHGTCDIDTEKKNGCAWNFSFPKSNVSLSCFIVTIGQFSIGIPEDRVDSFFGYKEDKLVWINQRPNYRQKNDVIPLIDSTRLFDKNVSLDDEILKRVLILKSNQEKVGLVINDIVHHANMPILVLPEEYRRVPAYLGATLFGNDPVLVINTNMTLN